MTSLEDQTSTDFLNLKHMLKNDEEKLQKKITNVVVEKVE